MILKAYTGSFSWGSSVRPMLMNIVHNLDCLDGMRQMPPESVRLICTSPPYNLRLKNTVSLAKHGRWKSSELFKDGYDGFSDDMPPAEYVAWQRECLTEMMRVLTPNGAIFYNHKWAITKGRLQEKYAITDGFPVRQIIIWHRAGTMALNSEYYLPNYEVIYLIGKPDFKLVKEQAIRGSIWRINQSYLDGHPATFPIELAERCVLAVSDGLVLDPFMGSGTTAIAAERHGREWIGFEQSAKYVESARKRIAAHNAQSKLPGV